MKRFKSLALCYLVIIILVFGYCFGNFARDKYLISTGDLAYFGMLPRGFFLGSIEPYPFEDYEISYVSTDSDIQMIYKGEPVYLNNVTINIGYSKDPGEVNLYYLEEGDERFEDHAREDAFTEVKCVMAQSGSSNERTYYFELPTTKKVTTFRIDPASEPLVFMGFDTTHINNPRTFASYFKMTGTKMLLLLFAPLLLWAFLGEIFSKNKER